MILPLEWELNIDMLPLISGKDVPLYSIVDNLERIWAKESINKLDVILSDKGR